MKRAFYLASILLLLLPSCGKEGVEESETIIPNTCSAELFYENGKIGLRILNAEGSMDLDAGLKVEFSLTGRTEYNTYDKIDGIVTFVNKTREYTEKKSFDYNKKIHVAKGESAEYFDVEELFGLIERHSDLTYYSANNGSIKCDYSFAFVETIEAVGTITFYRSQKQYLKDQQKAVTSDDPSISFSLSDPVDCKLELSLDKSIAMMSSKMYPSHIASFQAVFNDTQIPYSK